MLEIFGGKFTMIALITSNLVAIISAALLSFAFGMIWYNPKVFGAAWVAEQPHRKMPDDFQKDMGKGMIASLVDALFFATMALLLLVAYKIEGVLILAASVTIGIYTNTIFKGGTTRLFLIDAGYLLCQLIIITATILIISG